MKELISLLDKNKYRNIRTYIQSGNLVLQSHEKPGDIASLIHGRVCYFFAPEGIGRSKLAANLESCLGVAATGRNLNTVRKLKEMALEILM
jgi:uncharacterized protein (DUF1697 family)